jgi:hypothetical protein
VLIDLIRRGEEGFPTGFYKELVGRAYILFAEIAEVKSEMELIDAIRRVYFHQYLGDTCYDIVVIADSTPVERIRPAIVVILRVLQGK